MLIGRYTHTAWTVTHYAHTEHTALHGATHICTDTSIFYHIYLLLSFEKENLCGRIDLQEGDRIRWARYAASALSALVVNASILELEARANKNKSLAIINKDFSHKKTSISL